MIDSHCHLADEEFAADLAEVVARARAAGVQRGAVHPRRRRRGREPAARARVREALAGGAVRGRRPPAPGRDRSRAGAEDAASVRASAAAGVGAVRDRRDRPRLPLRLLAARRAAGGLRGAARAGARAALCRSSSTRARRPTTRSTSCSEAGRAASAACSTASPATWRWPRRALDLGFLHLVCRHCDVSASRRASARPRAFVPAGPPADRNRRAVPGAGAAPRQAQRAGVRCAGARGARRRSRRAGGGARRARSRAISTALRWAQTSLRQCNGLAR